MSRRGAGADLVRLLKETIDETPLPTESEHFRGVCAWAPIEDETGLMTAQAEHNLLVGNIIVAAHVDQETGAVMIEGEANQYTHKALRIPFNNRDNGMSIQIQCRNQNERARNDILWKRSFTRQGVKELFAEHPPGTPLSIDGHAPNVLWGTAHGTLTLTLKEERGHYYIEKASLKMMHSAYDAWIRSLKY